MINVERLSEEEAHYSINMSIAGYKIYVYNNAVLSCPVEIEGYSEKHFDEVLDEYIEGLIKAKKLAKKLR